MFDIMHCEEVQWCSLRSVLQPAFECSAVHAIECSVTCDRVFCKLRSSVLQCMQLSVPTQIECSATRRSVPPALSTLSLHALLRNQTFCKLSERPMSVTHVFCPLARNISTSSPLRPDPASETSNETYHGMFSISSPLSSARFGRQVSLLVC